MSKISARRSTLSAWSRVRHATFEQLEQRNLLSADSWKITDACFAQQSPFPGNYSSEHDYLRGVEQLNRSPDLGAQFSFSPRSFFPIQPNPITSVAATATVAPGSPLWSEAVDDAFENNDSFYSAADLGALSQPTTLDHLVMADQADWFQFHLNQPAGATATVNIQFQNSLGDLDLAVYNSSGRLVAYSNGTSDTENISLAGAASGTYFVLVYGYGGASNTNYTLHVNPSQSISDDQFEPNNSFALAADLGLLNASLTEQNLVMADSGDWYRFAMSGQGTSSNYVAINFQHSAGDLDMELYNGSGKRLGLSESVTNSEVVSLARLSAGTTAEYNALTRGNATSVPVDNTGGAGTRDAHWRESIFTSELMTGYVGPGAHLPLSRLTVASLADLGYQVNMEAADPFQIS